MRNTVNQELFMSETERFVRDLISEKLGVDKKTVVPSSLLVDDLGADSLDRVELVMALEDEFDLEIPDEDTEKMKTVKDVVSYVEARY